MLHRERRNPCIVLRNRFPRFVKLLSDLRVRLNSHLIHRQHLNKQQWREQTRAMIDQGAVLTPEETDMLLDYLVKNFGPEPEQ